MLKDNIVLVTGASAGIGRACAEAFAHQGCRLILSARRRERLAELAEQLHDAYRTPTLIVPLDVRDREAVSLALGGLPPAWSEIDILINNAGLSRGLDKLHAALPSDYEEMIDTNIKGLLWVTQAVLPGMVRRDRGHIINIGSISGHQVYAGGSVYCGTKWAVNAINWGLRIDLLGTRVRTSTVDPGMVQSEFSVVRFHGDQERAQKVYQSFPPLQPADVAEAVVWCATRPAHVNITEVIMTPTDQATVYASHPRGV